MRVQDYAADQTEWVVGNFYRNVRRVPEDKLDWKVMDTGRSVLDQVREVAMSPSWPVKLLRGEPAFQWTPENYAAIQAEMDAWESVDRCEAVHLAKLADLSAAMRAVNDEDLDKKIDVPFAPEPLPMSAILLFHYWNVTYHLGQILFIQTLYGDSEMVF